MKKIAKYATGALAVAGLASGLGGMTAATASAAELPPYDCAVALPLLDQNNPIIVGALGCKDNTEKFLEQHQGQGDDKGGEQGGGVNVGGIGV
ncbi:hypothetical protein ABT282_07530 [Streptomyces sp. NPDC000927]|uniref:hypothetical protein n=1 Tax=Streptomyces sp. NPDC000927 TaxID=3154371 RepID=UPI003317FD76